MFTRSFPRSQAQTPTLNVIAVEMGSDFRSICAAPQNELAIQIQALTNAPTLSEKVALHFFIDQIGFHGTLKHEFEPRKVGKGISIKKKLPKGL